MRPGSHAHTPPPTPGTHVCRDSCSPLGHACPGEKGLPVRALPCPPRQPLMAMAQATGWAGTTEGCALWSSRSLESRGHPGLWPTCPDLDPRQPTHLDAAHLQEDWKAVQTDPCRRWIGKPRTYRGLLGDDEVTTYMFPRGRKYPLLAADTSTKARNPLKENFNLPAEIGP